MPDDVITLGGPERPTRSDADESIETLFHAHYPQIVSTAFARVADWDRAEQLARQAYLRLLRHGRLIADPPAALQYLQRVVTDLSGEMISHKVTGRRVVAMGIAGEGAVERGAVGKRSAEAGAVEHGAVTNGRVDRAAATKPEAAADVPLPGDITPRTGGRVIDTDRGWREFEQLRARASTKLRRTLAAGVVAVIAALAIAVPLLGGTHGRRPPPHRSAAGNAPTSPRTYRRAIVARFELSGVISVAGNSALAWAVRSASQPATIEQPAAATGFQLVAIDLGKNVILYRKNLGRHPRAVAAGAGRVWLTTPYGRARGQIMRIDPATGRVVRKLHLPAGPCTALSFGFGHLFASCEVTGPTTTKFWRINPHTERAWQLTGTLHTGVSSIFAAPQALWYVANYYGQITGLANAGGNPQRVTVHDPSFRRAYLGIQSLVYGDGSLWVLGGDEAVTRIDPSTGRVVRHYTYRTYDPGRAGGLDFLTVGNGWLWFLDDGHPFSGVLKVSEATGLPVGKVPIAVNSCGQQSCSQIYYTPGSVWVPTAEQLIRIDPALTYYPG